MTVQATGASMRGAIPCERIGEWLADQDDVHLSQYLFYRRWVGAASLRVDETLAGRHAYMRYDEVVSRRVRRLVEREGTLAVSGRLRSLARRGIVERHDRDGKEGYRLTPPWARLARNGLRFEILGDGLEHAGAVGDGSWLRGARVLDVGSAAGQGLVPLARFAPRLVVGVDPSVEEVLSGPALLSHYGGTRLQARLSAAAAESLPFASGSFDVVLCNGTMNFLRRREAVAEFRRVLAPAGHLLLVVPGVSYYLREAVQAIGRGSLPGRMAFALLNGLLSCVLGVQLTYRGYSHHAETMKALSTLLAASGFRVVRSGRTGSRVLSRSDFFVYAVRR